MLRGVTGDAADVACAAGGSSAGMTSFDQPCGAVGAVRGQDQHLHGHERSRTPSCGITSGMLFLPSSVPYREAMCNLWNHHAYMTCKEQEAGQQLAGLLGSNMLHPATHAAQAWLQLFDWGGCLSFAQAAHILFPRVSPGHVPPALDSHAEVGMTRWLAAGGTKLPKSRQLSWG